QVGERQVGRVGRARGGGAQVAAAEQEGAAVDAGQAEGRVGEVEDRAGRPGGHRDGVEAAAAQRVDLLRDHGAAVADEVPGGAVGVDGLEGADAAAVGGAGVVEVEDAARAAAVGPAADGHGRRRGDDAVAGDRDVAEQV